MIHIACWNMVSRWCWGTAAIAIGQAPLPQSVARGGCSGGIGVPVPTL